MVTMSRDGKRVALFSTSFLPYSQTFIYEQLNNHERYTAEIFCKDLKNQDRFAYDRELIHKPPQAMEGLYEVMGYWPAFARVLKDPKYALMHAHFGNGAMYALGYKKRCNLPLVVTFHGNDVGSLLGKQRYQVRRWRYVWMAPKILQAADLMIAVSEELKQILAELSGRPEHIKVLRVGIDLERFSVAPTRDEGPLRAIQIGRFTQKKGHRYSLLAMNEVIDAGHDMRLTFVGGGGSEAEIRSLAGELGLTEKVTFAGVKTSDEIVAMLHQSDVLLAPSIVADDHDREGGIVVVKEAAACGIPSIGTWHGGIHEIIDHGETGYLVPERNPSAIAGHLTNLIEDSQRGRSLGLAAREKMEREYDVRVQTRKLERLYDGVME
jgi:colanic acid/amylovoran biosynthesis glycosyltransferase